MLRCLFLVASRVIHSDSQHVHIASEKQNLVWFNLQANKSPMFLSMNTNFSQPYMPLHFKQIKPMIKVKYSCNLC